MMRLLYFILFFTLTLNVYAVQAVNLKVLVKDDDSQPVEGANVKGSFFQDQVVDQQRLASHQGITDTEGSVELSGKEEIYIDLRVSKHGYYSTVKRVNVRGANRTTVDILLRKIRNPTAMYAKKTLLSAKDNRKSGVEFGYDLMVGDFVSPFGKGQVNDLIITHTYSMPDFWNRESKIVIRFSNPDDGLLPFYFDDENITSEFKSAYTAPVEGYNNEWVLTYSRKGAGNPVMGNMDARRNYYLRIRSERDEDGNVISGYYGKIYGEFPEVTYYLNPTPNDRNVEFDMKNNLFRNLKNEERPRAP